jgi:hypothetical protein
VQQAKAKNKPQGQIDRSETIQGDAGVAHISKRSEECPKQDWH